MSDYPPVKGLWIKPDKTVTEVTLKTYTDYRDCVLGMIERVQLKDGSDMWVNEEFLLGQFGPDDFNSIASDVCGHGRVFYLGTSKVSQRT